MIYVLITVIVICIVFLVVDLYELTHFELNEYTFDVKEKIDFDKEFLVLSDLHDNTYGVDNCKLLNCINATLVSDIIIAGDMVTGKKKSDWSKTIDFLLKLAENHRIYYVNGNHEYRTKIFHVEYGDKYHNYKKVLEEAGVIFLENRSVVNGNIKITGLEIDKRFYKKIKRNILDVEEIEDNIGKCDEEFYNILVAHNPRYIDVYKKWNPDMIICGHFHGGIARLPKIGGVISPQFDIFPKYSGGVYKLEKIIAIVSKGLGTHSIKVRLFNKPEVIKIKLQKH